MIKKYLLKVILVCAVLLQFANKASAQYAVGGDAGANLTGSIYWLTWDFNNPLLLNHPTDFTATSGVTAVTDAANHPYVWKYNDQVQIEAVVTNIASATLNNFLKPYTPGSYNGDGVTNGGDGLNHLFNGNAPDITDPSPAPPAPPVPPDPRVSGVPKSGLVNGIYGSSVSFTVAITVKIKDANGNYQSVSYPGMVIADAESMAPYESISGTTTSTTGWQLISLYKGPVLAAFPPGAQDHYAIDLSDGGFGAGSNFNIHIAGDPNVYPGNYNMAAVMYAHGATTLQDVTLRGAGNTALAVGFVMPFDMGDAPTTGVTPAYTKTGNYINHFDLSATLPGTPQTDLSINSITPATLTPRAAVYLGAANVDADGDLGLSPNDLHTATTDDAVATVADPSAVDDEDSAAPGTVKVNTNNAYSFQINHATNGNGTVAHVWAWLDFNRDGIFQTNELSDPINDIPANTPNSGAITVTWLNANFASLIKSGTAIVRLRTTTYNLLNTNSLTPTAVDTRSTTYAGDGETEDYQITIDGVHISGTVYNDNNGYTGGLGGTGIGVLPTTPTTTQLYAYLVDGTAIVDKVTVAGNGTYTFTGANNSTTYKVVISVNNTPAIGGTLTDILATDQLPAGYVASGDDFGSNNQANIASPGNPGTDGTANLQVAVSTPGTSLDITGINFGINYAPIVTNKTASTRSNTPVTINLLTGDTDDGTVVTTSAIFEDPAHAGTYNTTTFTNSDGTYSLNATTGVVTFTPGTSFTGVAAAINYKVADNFGTLSAPGTIIVTVTLGGADDAYTTPINTPIASTVKSNDGTVANTGTVSVTPVNGTNGTTSVDVLTNIVTFTPTPNFIGVGTYTYTLNDGVTTSAPINVTVTIKPIGTTDNEAIPINGAVTTTVLANDDVSSATGGAVSFGGTAPAHGTRTLIGNTIKYEPATDYIGTDTYTYINTNNGIASDPITVNITIKPIGTTDNEAIPINGTVTTTVLANDGTASATGGTVSFGGTAPAHGTRTLIGNTIKYDPATDYIGTDTYTYINTNNGAASNPITVNITIKPIGTTDNEAIPINGTVTTTVLANDGTASATGGVVSFGGTAPAHGTRTLIGNTIKYDPTTDYIGTDTYTYINTNNGVASNPITVNITIKPVGTTDNEIIPINGTVTTTVLANDGTASATGGVVSFGPTAPSHGAIQLIGNTIKYTPATDYIGTDTYTYINTNNGAASNPITVNITIKPVGTDDVATTIINNPVTTTVTANDGPSGLTPVTVTAGPTPAHGIILVTGSDITFTPTTDYVGVDTYTYTLTKNGITSDPITVNVTVKPVGTDDVATTIINNPVTTTVTTNDGPSGVNPVTVTAGPTPAHGTISVTGGDITFTPTTNYVGVDTYTYTLTKNGITSDPITVNVTVKPVGTDDVATTIINTPVTTTVTTNDGPSGVNPVTVTAGPTPAHGTISVTGSDITFTPTTNYVGVDTYTYTLTKNGVTSDPITVSVTVNPVGFADVDFTPVNTPVTTGVTANDGPSGVAPVTVSVVTVPAHGNTVVTGTNITYTPISTYVGSDTYTYTLTKNGLTSDPITVTINVKPIGTNDTDLTPVNTPVATIVTTNDGPSGTGATVTPTNGSHGTTTVSGGTVTYTPATNYVGTDTYTYTLTNNGAISDPITVTINVYSASMTLTKVANNGATKVGDVINYTLIVKNTGTVAITNIVVADAGADAGSISPASIATLAPGASSTVTANHTVVAADVAATQYSNQASVSGKDPKNIIVTDPKSDDPGTTTPDDPTIVPINAPAGSIALTKVGVFAGNKITYTFTIKNTGNVNLNTITLTDAKLGLSAVAITAPAGGLTPNATVTYSAQYTLTQADKDAGTVNNTATVGAIDINNNLVTNTGTATTPVSTSPKAVNDAVDVTAGVPEVIIVLTNDDPGTSTFNVSTIEIITNPVHGTVVANSNGTVTYTANTGYSGADSFTYRVKDANGYYTNIATVTIKSFAPVIKIPSLFTPNGDGVNDGFVIKDLADYAQNELIVLNRWGNEVYRKANYNNSWSGTGLNEGTYFYIVKLKKANGDSWVIQKGYVTLIRQFKK